MELRKEHRENEYDGKQEDGKELGAARTWR